MELSGVIQKLSDQFKSCINRLDFENAQLLNKAIENVLTVQNMSDSVSEGDTNPEFKFIQNSPTANDNKGGQPEQVTQHGLALVPASSTVASRTTGTSDFAPTAIDSHVSQVEILLWHKGTNCCLNTMTPIQLAALTPENESDGLEGIWVVAPAPKNSATLIFSVNVSSEGFLTTDELSKVISSARKSAGPNRALSIEIHDRGNGFPWSRSKKKLRDWLPAQGVKVRVLAMPPSDVYIPFFSVYSRRTWACHHTMAAFVVAHLNLIFPTWVVHKHFHQWSDSIAMKAKDILKTYLPIGYFSSGYIVNWFKGEFMSWCALLSKPGLIHLSPHAVCNDSGMENNFRTNMALLLNGSVRLIFVLD